MNYSLSPEFLHALARALGWAFLHALWQGALIAGAAATLLRAVPPRYARARHAICMAGLFLLLAGSLATFWQLRPAGALGALTQLEEMQASAETAPVEVAAPATLEPAASPVVFTQTWARRLEPVLPWLAALWCGGVTWLSLRQALGWRRLRQWRRESEPAGIGMQNAFDGLLERLGRPTGAVLRISAQVATPLLAGLLQPVVILPASLTAGLKPAEIQAILAHELAHFVRRDGWSHFAQMVLETLFFYHPAAWWLGSVARQEREKAADDLAVELTGDRRIYAGALTQLAALQLGEALAPAATGGRLLARIERILYPTRESQAASRWSLGVPLLLCLLVAGLLPGMRSRPAQGAPVAPEVAELRARASRELLVRRLYTDLTGVPPSREEIDAFVRSTAPDAYSELVARLVASSKAAHENRQWLADAVQTADPARREHGLKQIRTAMESGHVGVQRAALTAFNLLGPVDFEKASFRPEVRRLLTSPDAETALGAAMALMLTGFESQDLAPVLAMAERNPTPEMRMKLPGILAKLNRMELTGSAGQAVLKLLAVEDRRVWWTALSQIWMAKFSPELELRVREIAQQVQAGSGRDSVEAKSIASGLRLHEGRAKSEELVATAARLRAVADQQISKSVANREVEPDLELRTAKLRMFTQNLQTATKEIERQRDELVRWQAEAGQNSEIKKLLESLPEPTRLAVLKALAEQRAGEAKAAPVVTAAPPVTVATPPTPAEENRAAARRRGEEDTQRYSAEQLREIETLYQVANSKGKRTPEARESLTKLLEKYDKANRTGCALLYLGQGSEGEDRLHYLTRAVEKHSDCFYFNGCQVAGYGRYVLALTHWTRGEKDQARALFEEIKTTYKQTTDHRGRPMPELVAAAEVELAKQP